MGDPMSRPASCAPALQRRPAARALRTLLAGLLVALCALLLTALPAHAEDFAGDFNYRLQPRELAPGAWVVVGLKEDFSFANGGNIVNTGFIVGREGVIVIDTGSSKRYGEQMLAAIRRVTPLPIVLTVNTHHHPDHFLGNQAFPRATLAALPETLAAIRSEGEGFNANMYRLNGDWMRDTEVVVPERALAAGRQRIGGRDVELVALGGHTVADLVVIDHDSGTVYAADDGLRRDASMAGMAKLKPFFDKKYGRVTPANSSQITDGATWLVLASAAAVERFGLEPIGRIVDSQWAGLEPEQMGLGPVHATTPILQRHGLGLGDLDLIEINEAFAAQVIACLRAWQDAEYCRSRLGLPGALGDIDPARLNVDGGAVALGHPVGASGARIVLHLLKALCRSGGKRGIATICIGGGQGGAMLVEAL